MKSSEKWSVFAALALACTMFWSAGAGGLVQIPNPTGTPPPESAHEWFRLIRLGGHNSLAPVIWVSPYKFERAGNERLALLSQSDYQEFAHFVKSQCASEASSFREDSSLHISRFSKRGGYDVVCTMSPRNACGFLSASLQKGYFLSTKSTVEDLRFLSKSMGCSQTQ